MGTAEVCPNLPQYETLPTLIMRPREVNMLIMALLLPHLAQLRTDTAVVPWHQSRMLDEDTSIEEEGCLLL